MMLCFTTHACCSVLQDQAKRGGSTAQSGYSGGAFYTTVSTQMHGTFQ